MMRTLLVIAFIPCVLAATSARGAEPPADEKKPPVAVALSKQAASRFVVGTETFSEGLFLLAAVAFDATLDGSKVAAPEPIFNAAVAYERGGKWGVAKARWRRLAGLVTHPGSPALDAVAKHAASRLASLAAVTENQALPADILGPLRAQMRERLRRQTAESCVDVRYRFVPGAGVDSDDSVSEPVPFEAFGWAAVGAGALVVIIGVVLRVEADSLIADLEADRRPDGVVASPTQRQAHELAAGATRQSNASTVSLATGAGLIGLGVGLILFDHLSASPTDTSTAAGPLHRQGQRWRPGFGDVSVSVGQGGAGFTFGGQF